MQLLFNDVHAICIQYAFSTFFHCFNCKPCIVCECPSDIMHLERCTRTQWHRRAATFPLHWSCAFWKQSFPSLYEKPNETHWKLLWLSWSQITFAFMQSKYFHTWVITLSAIILKRDSYKSYCTTTQVNVIKKILTNLMCINSMHIILHWSNLIQPNCVYVTVLCYVSNHTHHIIISFWLNINLHSNFTNVHMFGVQSLSLVLKVSFSVPYSRRWLAIHALKAPCSSQISQCTSLSL